MKKIRIAIPMLRKEYFEFYIFDLSFKNNTKGELLLKYFYLLGYIFFILSFLLVPISDLFYPSLDKDTAVLNFLLLIIPINLAIYLATLVLNGRRRLVDPPFFLAVLIFALGTTTASVLTAIPSLSNTFGGPGIRSMAGISIMIFIAIYYLVIVYIHNRESFRRSFKLLIGAIIFYLVWNALNATKMSSFEDLTLLATAFGGVFVLGKSSINFRRTKALIAILLVALGIYTYFNEKIAFSSLNLVLIPIALSFGIVLLALFLSKKSFLKVILNDTKADLKSLRHRKIEFWELARISSAWLVILAPVILIVLVIYINSHDPTVFSNLKSQILAITNALNSITDFSKGINGSSLGVLFFGNGLILSTTSNSFIINIIISQGFLGFAAYLFLWTYGAMTAARFVYYNFKKGGNYFIPSWLLFIMTLIPLESLFFYPGIKLIYLWWVAFAFITVKYKFRNKESYIKLADEDFEIQTSRFKNKKIGRIINYLITLLLVIAGIYISYTFMAVITK